MFKIFTVSVSADVSFSVRQRNRIDVPDKFKSCCKFHKSQVSPSLMVLSGSGLI